MRTKGENFTDPADINAILDMRSIAVVGLSPDPSRPSYGVARYLQSQGYEIIPVNPSESEVLGVKAYGSLSELPEPPDVVDVFRRPEYVDDIVDEAIKVGAKAIWLQDGVIAPKAAHRAREAGLITVMNTCTYREHARRRTRSA